MGAHTRLQAAPITDPLHYARDVGGAIQLGHLAGNANVLVNERLVVADHVLVRLRAAVLDGVGGTAEEVPPEGSVEELQEGENPCGARRRGAWGFTIEEEREEAQAEGVALDVESVNFSL